MIPARLPFALEVMLLGTVGLPTVLLLNVKVWPAAVPCMETTKKAGTVAGAPLITSAMPPMLFPLTVVCSGVPVPARIACRRAADPDKVNTILSVALWLPMVLLLQFKRPDNSEISDCAAEVLELVIEIF